MNLPQSYIDVLKRAGAHRTGTATHWFARCVGKPNATTRDAYLVLKRMEKLGLMEGLNWNSGKVRWWRSTEKGVELLAQQESEKETVATELEWLQFFYGDADFGPADDDVRRIIEKRFTKTTGKSLPHGYQREDEE